MADDKRQAQAFAEASKNLEKVTAELKDYNQSAGKEIADTIKGDLKKAVDPFVSAFNSIPGVNTLGSIGKTILNKGAMMFKDKREQALLRKRLGLTKEQFEALKKQKAVLDAQKEYNTQLDDVASKLLGFTQGDLLAVQKDANGQFMSISAGINKLVGIQGDQVKSEEQRQAILNKGAAKRVEQDNERMRQESATYQVFQKIASGIDNLAEGVMNIKAEDVGMGLLAPIGLIGSIITTFVGAFVAEIKKQFTAIKGIFKTFDALFEPIKNLMRNVGKTFAGPDTAIGKFFSFIGNTFRNIKGFFTTGLTNLQGSKFIGTASTMLDDFIKTVKSMFAPISKVFGVIKTSMTSVSALAAEGGIISKILGFAKGFGSVLGKLFLPVTIVMSAFDFITGFIDGWKESDGNNIVSKFIDAVGGGLSKLVGNLIGIPLDLLKSGVSWILGKMGFSEAESFLDSFSFVDLIKGIVMAPYNLVSGAVDYIVGLFTGENDLIEDLMSGMKNIGEAAKDLLKGILRGILPKPGGDEGGIFGFIKKAVTSVIPDGVYEFAGLNPETGERILPDVGDDQVKLLQEQGLFQDMQRAADAGDADRMEEILRQSEEMKGQGTTTIVQNIQTNDNSSTSNASTVTTQPLKDQTPPEGTVPVM